MSFTTLDWTIILGYLVLAFTTGVWVSRLASKGLSSYFLAGRSLPWWWLGTSMVATTFAADTPLVVSGLVAKYGIAGNWFWWSWVFSSAAMTVFFAARWRKSEVLTDAEIIELRYEGRPAAFLRAFKAFFLSIVLNCIILGWVFRAMSKIADPFIRWESILGASSYRTLVEVWPSWLIFDNPNNTMTVLFIFTLTVTYSSLGGMRGVVLTDLVQFLMALTGSVLFAFVALRKVGGLDGLISSLHSLYPDAGEILSFTPSLDAAWLPFQVFLVYFFIQWWAKQDSDGSGYFAQRLMSAKTPNDAVKGSLWYSCANFALRTWPWVLIGLISLVLFPRGAETSVYAEGARVAADREMAYPILMKLLLPPGLLGLLFASLLAAFMSTVDTHLNWGTSYLVNDFYKRFYRPKASEKELIRVSRLFLVGLAILSIIVASQISSIEKAWKFFIALAAGMGLPTMLRWLWWRINAWTEIVGMASAIVTALVLYRLFPETKDEYLLVWIVLVSTAAALAATFLTRPVSRGKLKEFCARVGPVGFWGDLQGRAAGPRGRFWSLLCAWVAASLGLFALMFGVGHLLLTSVLVGVGFLVFAALALKLTLHLTLE